MHVYIEPTTIYDTGSGFSFSFSFSLVSVDFIQSFFSVFFLFLPPNCFHQKPARTLPIQFVLPLLLHWGTNSLLSLTLQSFSVFVLAPSGNDRELTYDRKRFM